MKKAIAVILSVIVGVLGLLLMPLAVIFNLDKINPSEDYAYMDLLDNQTKEDIMKTETTGPAIADIMKSPGIQEQTLKTQIINMRKQTLGIKHDSGQQQI